jgi:hypothetical protein
MRNLARYPITFDEKMSVLERLRDRQMDEENRDMICGSIIGPALRAVMKDVERLAEIDKTSREHMSETRVETFRQSMEDSRNARDQ